MKRTTKKLFLGPIQPQFKSVSLHPVLLIEFRGLTFDGRQIFPTIFSTFFSYIAF